MKRLSRQTRMLAVVIGTIGLVGCTGTPDRSEPSAPTTSASSIPRETVTPSEPATPTGTRTLVYEGTYQGSDETWKLHAALPSRGGLCLYGPTAGVCGIRTRGDTGEIVVTSGGGTKGSGCLFGAADAAATAVGITFADGDVQELAPEPSTLSKELVFFGVCWEGSRDVKLVESLNDSGNRLDAIESDIATGETS